MRNLLKEKVLSGKRQFDSVFLGKKLVTSELVFYYVPSGLDYGRLGVIVGRKVTPGAVNRNRFKRRLRDMFWCNKERFRGVDVVIIAREGQRLENFGALERCFDKLLGALKR